MDELRRRNTAYVALIAFAAIAVLIKQFVFPGVYCCIREDTVFFLNWTRQFSDALASGLIYPRWLHESHGGYGNPTFVFYSPLAIYLTALIRLLTGDVALSVALFKFTGLLLSGLFMFMFMSGIRGARAGLVSALVYTLLPYRVFDQYFVGVFPSKFAFVWFPLILHFARKAALEERPGRGMAGLAISYALLCLTHLLSAYMFAFVLAAYGAVSAGKGRVVIGSARIAMGGLLGMCMAGFFLLPVLSEGWLVHLESFGAKEWGRYWNNFLFYIWTPRSPYNPPFYGYIARTVLWSAAAGTGMFLLGRTRAEKETQRTAAFFIIAVILCLFLMSSLSWPVWKYVPGLSMVIFPTRWATVMVFCLACLSGIGFAEGHVAPRKYTRLLTIALFTAAALPLTVAITYDFEIISSKCRFSKNDVSSFPRDMDVEEYVPRSVSLDWLRSRENAPPDPAVFSTNAEIPAKIDIMRWDAHERSIAVYTPKASTVAVRTFYFPGWRAWLDGTEVNIGIKPVTGAMLLDIPAGRHEVHLRFGNTPAMLTGWFVSGLALICAVFLLRRGGRRRTKHAGRQAVT